MTELTNTNININIKYAKLLEILGVGIAFQLICEYSNDINLFKLSKLILNTVPWKDLNIQRKLKLGQPNFLSNFITNNPKEDEIIIQQIEANKIACDLFINHFIFNISFDEYFSNDNINEWILLLLLKRHFPYYKEIKNEQFLEDIIINDSYDNENFKQYSEVIKIRPEFSPEFLQLLIDNKCILNVMNVINEHLCEEEEYEYEDEQYGYSTEFRRKYYMIDTIIEMIVKSDDTEYIVEIMIELLMNLGDKEILSNIKTKEIYDFLIDLGFTFNHLNFKYMCLKHL